MDFSKQLRPGVMNQIDPVKENVLSRDTLSDLAILTHFILNEDIPSISGYNNSKKEKIRFSLAQMVIWRTVKEVKNLNWDFKTINVSDSLLSREMEENILRDFNKRLENEREEYETSWIYCVKGSDQPVCAFSAKRLNKREVKVRKKSSDTNVTDNNSYYNLEGADFTFYKKGKKVGAVTTRKDGSSGSIKLLPGTYIVKETKPPKNGSYHINNEEKSITISKDSKDNVVYFLDKPKLGEIEIYKKSSNEAISDTNKYSLEGAEFTLYKDKDKKNPYKSVATDKNGYAKLTDIPLGIWYLAETKPPKGFLTNEEVRKIEINGQKINVRSEFLDLPSTGRIELKKSPLLEDVVYENENYSLEGAKYLVENLDAGIKKTIVTDYEGNAAIENLPLGKYFIKEIEPSKGYELDPKIHEVILETEGKECVVVVGKVFSKERPKTSEAGFLVEKQDSISGEKKPCSNGSFKDAYFEVAFYDRKIKTDPENLGKGALRRWIYKTDDSGRVNLQNENCFVKEGSDELY